MEVYRLTQQVEQGPGGVWCDVDVVEFSYYGASAATIKEEFYTELVDGLRGSFPCIGSGSQVPLHGHSFTSSLFQVCCVC